MFTKHDYTNWDITFHTAPIFLDFSSEHLSLKEAADLNPSKNLALFVLFSEGQNLIFLL